MKKTPEQIHYNMQRIKNRDSEIEILLRQELCRRKLRYRKNVAGIVGKPDIVFLKAKVAVFCDSEFWHGFNWEERQNDFSSNVTFWKNKIEQNMKRDQLVNSLLKTSGWKVLRFWGQEIRDNTSKCGDIIERAVRDNGKI